jgi:dTDP-4-dehydrorhamnose reductase
MRIIVIGANGMLGTDLCLFLKEQKIAPIELDLPRFNITNVNQAIDTIKSQKPDIIINAAAFTDVDGAETEKADAYAVNTQGAWAVALAAQQCQTKLVYMSTDYVFDGTKKTAYLETDLTNPINYYGQTKLLGEKTVIEHLKHYFIVRTSWLFGKHGKNFIKTILKLCQEKDVIEVVNDQVGSPTNTKDLSAGIFNLMNSGKFGIFHLTNAGQCSWYEFACEIVKQAGYNTKVIPISSNKIMRHARRPANSVLDNSKYKKHFNSKLRSWQDALKDYLSDIIQNA